MNYPVWDVPASGLLIAAVAIVHVFVSHFAVGGGLFLVLTERKARRESDAALRDYVRRHSRFFILLTLVFGALTGVGIWFTIGLVSPQATSTLINTFVWAWAIEWTFFLAEIAAAMVYYYGWDRLPPRVHEAVGWIYFVNAWLSLVVINGILTFMLTPGDWVTTRGFWDGLLNPTYMPALVARTLAAVGLAGLYAMLTASWIADAGLKEKVARYSGWNWIVPAAVTLPLSLAWYLAAAAGAGVPVAEIFGASDSSLPALFGVLISGSATGHPIVLRAAFVSVASAAALTLLTLFIILARARRYGVPLAAVMMLLGFAAMGGAEWVREGLRKPFVLGQVLFVNGVRLPAPGGVGLAPGGHVERFGADHFTITALNETGVFAASQWVRPVPPALLAPEASPARVAHEGRELFRASCAACHTIDGYVAIRPLVRDKSVDALDGLLTRLAVPVDAAGRHTTWADADLRLKTWRDRRMPPFAGTATERRQLAAYLAILGGANPADVAPKAPDVSGYGRAVFESHCAACHGPGAMMPFSHRGRPASELFELIGRLPEINEMMPAFEGTSDERNALADHLATLVSGAPGGGGR